MSDSDSIIGGGALQGEATDDDDDGIGPAPPARLALRRERGRPFGRRPRSAPRHGSFTALLVADRDLDGLTGSFLDRVSHDSTMNTVGYCECEWTFTEADEAATQSHSERLVVADIAEAATPAWGYVQYKVAKLWTLLHFVPAPRATVKAKDGVSMCELVSEIADEPVEAPVGQVGDHVQALSTLCHVFEIGYEALDQLQTIPVPWLLYSVKLTLRSDPRLLVPRQPKSCLVKRWRAECHVLRTQRRQGPAAVRDYDDIVLELPAAKRPRHADRVPAQSSDNRRPGPKIAYDAIKIIRALNFRRFLRSSYDFDEALSAAKAYENDAEPEDMTPSERISRPLLERCLSKTDVISMLLHRRQFHADVVHDTIACIDLFSDASPVSGRELQGMVAIIRRKDESWYVTTLPGSTLCYGHADAMSEGIALLWGIYLIAGTDEGDVKYFCSKVTAVTTDFGLEHTTTELPDMRDAFFRWMDGVPFESLHNFVQKGDRLFPNALRISGWGHTFGNLAKGASNTWFDWPVVLGKLRALCTFWGNPTWKDHVKYALRGRADIDLTPLGKGFTASFAKWRYETVNTVLSALAPSGSYQPARGQT